MTEPTLFTSRWANKELADLRCVPTGISRGTPRFATGYRYRQVRELAPGDEAWSREDEAAFAEAYAAQLDALGIEAIVSRLARIAEESGGLPLVLLCYECSDEFCHRHVLRRWLAGRGVRVKELEPGDLPPRPDAPQPSLFDHHREETP